MFVICTNGVLSHLKKSIHWHFSLDLEKIPGFVFCLIGFHLQYVITKVNQWQPGHCKILLNSFLSLCLTKPSTLECWDSVRNSATLGVSGITRLTTSWSPSFQSPCCFHKPTGSDEVLIPSQVCLCSGPFYVSLCTLIHLYIVLA